MEARVCFHVLSLDNATERSFWHGTPEVWRRYPGLTGSVHSPRPRETKEDNAGSTSGQCPWRWPGVVPALGRVPPLNGHLVRQPPLQPVLDKSSCPTWGCSGLACVLGPGLFTGSVVWISSGGGGPAPISGLQPYRSAPQRDIVTLPVGHL